MRRFMYFNQFSLKKKKKKRLRLHRIKLISHSGKAPSAMLPIFVCGGGGLDKFCL